MRSDRVTVESQLSLGTREVSRRTLLSGSVLVGAAGLSLLPAGSLQARAAAASPGSATTAQATYVLVHGAWHGGWCWNRVAPLLRAAGADVFTPTLSGLGDRVHRAGPDIDLETHIQDMVHFLEYEDLNGVVLVGHSYAGMVITGVADRLPARLTRLIYLDAFVPGDGQALLDFASPEGRAGMLQDAQARGDGWRLLAPAPDSPFLNVTDPDDVAWVTPRLTAQPVQTFTQPVRLSGAGASLPRTYIWCTRLGAPSTFAPFAERLRNDPTWRYRELATGHDAMITAPRELTQLLLEPA
jgi:pimeloyl-ACP methyl ester carboxylesterase